MSTPSSPPPPTAPAPPASLPHPLSPTPLLLSLLLALLAYLLVFRPTLNHTNILNLNRPLPPALTALCRSMASLFSTVGQYSDLLTVFPLPKSLLESLLPEAVFDSLMPVPGEYGLEPAEHLVMLHLGRQINTGVPIFKFSAQEAKFEIPFVAPPGSSSRASAVASVYKHSLWSNTVFLTTAARLSMGLRTERAVFDPADGPVDAGNVKTLGDMLALGKYEVKGKVSWEGRRLPGAFAGEQYATRERTVAPSEMYWFGDYAGGTLCKFPFTHAREPVPYKATIRLHLPSIQLGKPLPSTANAGLGLRDNFRVEGEWLVLEGVTTWWTDASWVLQGPTKVAVVEKAEGK